MSKKIMVVDDEPDIRETVKTVLEANGYEVSTAVNGADCIKKLKDAKKKPDLVLLDVMMPGIPSREVVEQIKGVKVIYLTAVRATEAEKEDLMKSEKIVDYIEKPFDVDSLLKRIKKFV